ncbi:VanW family protein [Butyrivibrio sp. XPD2006]|uniref:VanW family protein n=1 Tax=Butyrivibrio sp. XPD2006 TaxID=1280668 RepID=UPI0003B2F824|nr:VanW family protein [Butyrivibrio sp. XPD2006]
MKKFFGAVGIAVLLMVLIPSTRAYASDGRQIAKGVFIGPVDVSGMSISEAESAVTSYVDEVSTQPITLVVGEGKEQQFTGLDIGLYWSNTSVVEDAYSLGHQGNVIERYKALKDLQHQNHTYDIAYGYERETLEGIIASCAEAYDQEKINYTLTKTEDGFKVSDGQTGYLVDQPESVSIVEDFIQNKLGGGDNTVQLSVKADEPQGSEEELALVRDVLGTYTTSYKTSGASRSANVANGCRLINGSTIYPGEEFSVLDTITPFTESNGYFPAGSYLNGLVVESIGGGICQVSTTLYNAVLLSELEVTERHNHSMIVTYVSPSADAAIAESGGKNFKFVNSTEHPIYIEGYTTSDKHITFTIYGVETRPSGRKVSYESEVLETTPASADEFVTDPSQGVGYVGTQSAHLGYKAQLWKIVTENGETSREVVNSSTYKMVPKIVTVGTAGADEAALSQLQTAIATRDVGTVKAVAGALAAARNAAGTEGAEAANQAAADAVNAANEQLRVQAEQAAQAQQPEGDAESIQTN